MSEIKAFDPKRRDNAALIVDLWTLGYLPEPILDLTYGHGKFWKRMPDLDVHANDLNPNKGKSHYDFRSTPWHRAQWPTVVFDPPYRCGGTPSDEDFDDRFGLEEYKSIGDVRALIEDGTREACRIAVAYVIVKVQDHISSASLQPETTWVVNAAESMGATLLDSLHVIGGRGQPAGRGQKRARHGYSTALVFTMPKRRPTSWEIGTDPE